MSTARRITETEVAKIIRNVLKDKFPGTKFSVKTHKYSGGSSIDVDYTDGPALTNVKEYIANFEGATFDGMQDLKEYHGSTFNGELVTFANDFLFVNRHYSEQVYKNYAEWANSFYGDYPIKYNKGTEGRFGHQDGYCSGNYYALQRMWDYLANTGF